MPSLSTSQLLIAAATLSGLATVIAYALMRRHEQRRARSRLAQAILEDTHIPPSLHPVIDTDVCIGSGSCIAACPEGKILGLVDGAATLVNGARCIGHGQCAAECPVDAIKLVFGT